MKRNENCGLFGICGDKECFLHLRTGAFNLQHRGQKFSGIATCDDEKICCRTEPGLLKPSFPKKDKENFKGSMGIAHVSLKEPQPLIVEESNLGKFAIAFSGNIANQEELEIKYDILPSRDKAKATEVLAKIIRQSKSFPEGIKKVSKEVRGGWVITILIPKEGVYVARDTYGLSPSVLGKSIDGCAVSSESVALNKIGMNIVRDVKPGEIALIERNGFQTVEQIESKRRAYCSFEWAYTARISSIIEGIPVKRARANMGAMLSREDDVEADIVAGVPMSGIGHALGYAQKAGIPFEEVFEYNRYSDRSYTPLDQKERDEVAGEKLALIEETIKGKRIVLADDSIVRGTQLRKLIFQLKEAGAKEVHLRIACPPLIAPCRYTISTRTSEELMARRHSVEEARKMIGATTLRHNAIDDFVAAIGLPKKDLCLACFTGEYPL